MTRDEILAMRATYDAADPFEARSLEPVSPPSSL